MTYLTSRGLELGKLVNNNDPEIQDAIDKICDDWFKQGLSIDKGTTVLIRMMACNIAILTQDIGLEGLKNLMIDVTLITTKYAATAQKKFLDQQE